MVRVLNQYGGLPAARAVMKFLDLDCGPPQLPQVMLTADDETALHRELDSLGFFNWIRTES